MTALKDFSPSMKAAAGREDLKVPQINTFLLGSGTNVKLAEFPLKFHS